MYWNPHWWHRKRKRILSVTWNMPYIAICVFVTVHCVGGMNDAFANRSNHGATNLIDSGINQESLAGGIHNRTLSVSDDDFDLKKEIYTDMVDPRSSSSADRIETGSEAKGGDGQINLATISPYLRYRRSARNGIDKNTNVSQVSEQYHSASNQDGDYNMFDPIGVTTVNSSYDTDLGITFTKESPEASSSTPTTSKAVADIWYICHGILGTVVEVFGIAGNIMSIVVLVHPDMRSSTGILLTSLAMYDIIVLMSYLFLLSMDQMFQRTHVYANFLTDFHQPTYPVWYSTSSIAFMGSSYTTVAISIERLIVVTFPLKASAWCTESRAKAAVVIIFIFAALYNIPRYMVFSIETSWDEVSQKHQISSERTRFSKTYFFKTVYSVTMNIIIKVFLPLTVLIVASCFMIRAVRRNSVVRRSLQGGALGSNHSKFSAIVVAVMVFSLMSLLTGAAEVILLQMNDQQFHTANDCEIVCAAMSAVSELMAILNSGINFLLFCVFGTKFREVFRRRFCKKREMVLRNSNSHTTSLP